MSVADKFAEDRFPPGTKPVPTEPEAIPAADANRRRDSNLAPQGEMHPDSRPESMFTPEGDGEEAAHVPPSATDPA